MAERLTHKKPGDVWVAQSTFKVGTTPTDPTTVAVKYQTPAGVETVLLAATDPAVLTSNSQPVAKTATGVFRLNPGIALTTSGYWFVRFTGTGAVAASDDQQIVVDPSEFTSDAGVDSRALVTLAETKDWLNITQEDTSEDLDLVRMINDLSQRIIDISGRELKPITTASTARTFPVDMQAVRQGRVQLGDVNTVTLVEIIDDDWSTVAATVTSSYYTLHPTVREAWQPYRYLELHPDTIQLRYGMRIRVTGTWGFPAVPGNIRQAVLDTIAAARDRHVESYAVELSAGENQPAAVRTTQTQILALPPRAQAVADSYRDLVVV